MSYEIRVLECPRSNAERDLNVLGEQGWQLVTCWTEKEKWVAVFQRPSATAPHKTVEKKSPPIPAAIPPEADEVEVTLDSVLEACLAKPPSKPDFPHGVSVSALAKAHGTDADSLLASLRVLGLKSKDDDSKRYSTSFEGHSLWLNQANNGAWFVNAKAFKAK
jgi:hypothetical protein